MTPAAPPAPAGAADRHAAAELPIPSVVPEPGRLSSGPTAALTGCLPDRRPVLASPAG